jgi:hypothetical protein
MNHYFTIYFSKEWRIRISIENRLDLALELFSRFDGDNWSGIYLNFCSSCRRSIVQGFHFSRRDK